MRVDTTTTVAQFGDLDALARFKGYLSAVRRRWYLVVIPMLMGAGLGWVTAPTTPTPEIIRSSQYYRASHVLIDETKDDSTGTATSSAVNLAQAAYLVNTGEVPKAVAAKLHVPVEEAASSVIGLPRSQVSSVEVQAVGSSSGETVKLADTSAAELLKVLEAQAKASADKARDRIISQLDTLDRSISDLNLRIAAQPANLAQLEAQQRSQTNQYSLVYEQFSQLAQQPPPTAGLVSLEGAKPVSITKAEYERLRKTIRDGADYVTGAPTTTVPDGGGSSGVAAQAAGTPTRMAFAAIIGLLLGLGLVLLLDRFDGRLRRRVDVEAAMGAPVLAEIPPLSRHEQRTLAVVAHTQARSRAAEAYRVIRGSLLFALMSQQPDRAPSDGAVVLMVTSANPAEGKTTTVVNLAAVFAEGGFSVLVINCDFRRPQVHKYLVAADGPAPVPVADMDGPTSVPMAVSDTTIERVRLITGMGEGGHPDANPLEVVAMQRRFIKASRHRFDVILLDTAPLLSTNDASELLSETDQVLVIVRAGVTRVESARRTAEVLRRFEAPVVGVVMNDSDDSPAADYYYAYASSRPTRKRPVQRDEADGPAVDVRIGQADEPFSTSR